MWARAMWALLALEVVATLVDLTFGPWGPRVHWEERFNARAGVQIACGHIDAVWAMQYRTFCGGCTAEAVMAAPLFLALGPVVKVWKVIPTLFHLGIVAAVARLYLEFLKEFEEKGETFRPLTEKIHLGLGGGRGGVAQKTTAGGA